MASQPTISPPGPPAYANKLYFRTSQGEEVEVPRITRKVYEAYHGEPVASREQFPVCLAYAVTVHKLQGVTTAAELHAVLTRWTCWDNLVDRRRMLYVVLSRATAYANLRIKLPCGDGKALLDVLQAGLEERKRLWATLMEADMLK
jgi:ATP-dependent exoDNAse (exonuclease V) alpha subunit